MGGRSWNCGVCGQGFLKPQTALDHERQCIVLQHARHIPIDTPKEKR